MMQNDRDQDQRNGPLPPQGGEVGENPAAVKLDLRLYWAIVYHRKWLILGCLVLFLALAAFQLRRAEPIYSATATLMYDNTKGKNSPLGGEDTYYYAFADNQEIQTQIGVIRSPKVTKRVIDALGLLKPLRSAKPEEEKQHDVSPVALIRGYVKKGLDKLEGFVAPRKPTPIDPEVAQWQDSVSSIESKMKVKQQPGTKLIDVVVMDSDPKKAARIADEACAQYIALLNEEKTDSFGYAVKWIRLQTDEAKRRLEEAEKNLYSSKQGQFDTRVMEQKLAIATASMKTLSEQIQALKQKIALAEASNEGKGAESVRQILLARDNAYDQSLKNLKDLELKRISMAAEFKPEFGELSKLDREIAAVKAQIKKSEENLLETARGEADLARLEVSRLGPLLTEQEEMVQKIQEEMIQFRVLQRDVDSAKEFYKILLDRSKQVGASSEVEPISVSVVSKAKVPRIPDYPQVLKTVNQFGIFGLALGVCLALLLHQMDRTVKDAQQVEALFGLAPLATIPHLDEAKVKGLLGKKSDKTHLPVLTRPKSISSEAFRYLRTSLQYSTPGHPPQVILVTSAMPREGKSTISSNLALAFASRGQRTLLVDADLKEPTLHKTFDIFRTPGLTEILTGQEEPDSIIQTLGIENFGMLTAGRSSPTPVDLLESATMKAFLLEMRKRYDVIIMDSAPLMDMADSLVLARMVDGTCIVVNRGKTPIEALHKSALSLRRVNIHPLGVVYNSKHKMSGPGGGYGYGYGYGYGGYGYGGGYGGYGYGQTDEDEEPSKPAAPNQTPTVNS